MELEEHINRLQNSLRQMKFTPPTEGEKGGEAIGEKDDEELQHVTKELESYRDLVKLKGTIIPLIKMGLKKYYEIEEETPFHIKGVDNASVTLLVCYSFEVHFFGNNE